MVSTWEWDVILQKLDALRESLEGTAPAVMRRRARLLALSIDGRKILARTDTLYYEIIGEVNPAGGP